MSSETPPNGLNCRVVSSVLASRRTSPSDTARSRRTCSTPSAKTPTRISERQVLRPMRHQAPPQHVKRPFPRLGIEVHREHALRRRDVESAPGISAARSTHFVRSAQLKSAGGSSEGGEAPPPARFACGGKATLSEAEQRVLIHVNRDRQSWREVEKTLSAMCGCWCSARRLRDRALRTVERIDRDGEPLRAAAGTFQRQGKRSRVGAIAFDQRRQVELGAVVAVEAMRGDAVAGRAYRD